MVLLHDTDSALGPQRWQLGRVDAIFPGPDGRVRIVDVKLTVPDPDPMKPGLKKTQFRILRRPITRLSPLPFDDELVGVPSSSS